MKDLKFSGNQMQLAKVHHIVLQNPDFLNFLHSIRKATLRETGPGWDLNPLNIKSVLEMVGLTSQVVGVEGHCELALSVRGFLTGTKRLIHHFLFY